MVKPRVTLYHTVIMNKLFMKITGTRHVHVHKARGVHERITAERDTGIGTCVARRLGSRRSGSRIDFQHKITDFRT